MFRTLYEVHQFKTDVPEDESHITFETCWTIFNEIHVLNIENKSVHLSGEPKQFDSGVINFKNFKYQSLPMTPF
jgi:hypothetical protein